MNNNFYYVISIEENGKRYAYAKKINECNNLVYELNIKNVEYITPTKTMKKAKEIAMAWNKAYKDNNYYLYDETF